jgi:hypothetical protein
MAKSIATGVILLVGLLTLVTGQYVSGYSVVQGSMQEDSTGVYAQLSLNSGSGSPYGNDFTTLDLTIKYITNNILRVQIVPSDSDRWRVPEVILQGPAVGQSANSNATAYSVSVYDAPFGLSITRNSDGEVIFNSTQTATPNYNGLIVSAHSLLPFTAAH